MWLAGLGGRQPPPGSSPHHTVFPALRLSAERFHPLTPARTSWPFPSDLDRSANGLAVSVRPEPSADRLTATIRTDHNTDRLTLSAPPDRGTDGLVASVPLDRSVSRLAVPVP